MIAKHIPIRFIGKSSFAGLVQYITDGQSKRERLDLVMTTNCMAGTVQAAIDEVLATQHLNTRATGDKTFHLLVSFRAGEKPVVETLKAIEERLCTGLGYGEHQRISAVHHDTDNLHIHIAINKIHPTRKTMHEPFQSYRKLAKLCAIMERDYGLGNDNHTPVRSIAEGRAADMERHSGIESLVGWIKRECLDEIRAARSWIELHQVLQTNGLKLRTRGNGFVFEADNGTHVKASTVARNLSRAQLEARLGPFREAPELQTQTQRQYRKKPVRLKVNTTELYARYKSDQQNLATAQRTALDRAGQRKNKRIEAAKRSNRLRRGAIKLLSKGRLNKKLLYSQASRALRTELEVIHKDYQRERQACYDTHKRRTWADWLKAEALQGNAEALTALRARRAGGGLKGNTVRGFGELKPGRVPVVDDITKKGTIIFRVGNSSVRDDGSRLQVSRGANKEGLKQALLLAMGRYGSRIEVNGTAVFKAQIVRAAVDSQLSISFVDATLESRRRALAEKMDLYGRQKHLKTSKGISR